ncbi:unnamed protein product [Trichogramma brassicae]|uniref:Uncharacterized protein n=1 Tax=Trichogramma brassicae TaxID=86971 RepID=A0A6H5HZ13_9HYME|nr:unnamed protein product [Trichogramma brassicae]
MAEISFGKGNDKKIKDLLSDYTKMVEFLLSKGASPNVADARGRTPLHIVCQGEKNLALAPELMKICDDKQVPLTIDVRGVMGRTALHVAMEHHNIFVAVELLAKGANQNSADEEASTPLHLICRDDKCSSAVVKVFLTINEGPIDRPVQVDARDNLGRTPLQWAVAHLEPEKVDLLLDHGADLSNFVFPSEDYFAKKNKLDCTLQVVVFHTMSIVNSLERKGYQMDQTAALTIMKTFAKYGLFVESIDIRECLSDDKYFKRIATEQLVKQNLSLYDFLQLTSLEMFTFFTKNDYETFKPKFSSILPKYREAFDLYLCQTVAGVFFRKWALALFSLSEKKKEEIGRMTIKDLWDTCMASAKKDAKKNAKKDAKKNLLALFALTISAQPVIDDEQPENSLEIDLSELDDVESRNPALAIAVRVLAGAFRWAAKHCLKEAAQNCRQHWKHPKALVNCAQSCFVYKAMANNTRSLDEMISLQNNTDWSIEEQPRELLSKLDALIENWEGQLPDLSNIFRPKQMNWLIWHDCMYGAGRKVVNFAIRTGYKNQPDTGEDGKPVLRHGTPIHFWAVGEYDSEIVRELFMIYDRFDVNYVDETGFTHFHVACRHGCEDIVQEFLKKGQDPNCLMPETGDSPLHLAVANNHKDVAALLLNSGANPNLTNAEGSTPLHAFCQQTYDKSTKISCEPSSEVSAMLALTLEYTETVKLLVSQGADPNVADARGLAPLHIACQGKYNVMMSLELMEICKMQEVQLNIDARDKMSRSAFDVALEHHNIIVADDLLSRGAEPYFVVEGAQEQQQLQPVSSSLLCKSFLGSCWPRVLVAKLHAHPKHNCTS